MNPELKEQNTNKDFTIIIIEDDVSLNVLIQKELTRLNHRTIGFNTGNETLEWFEKNPNLANYLLLVDYQLFDMNGEFLIRTLKNNYNDIPFIIGGFYNLKHCYSNIYMYICV